VIDEGNSYQISNEEGKEKTDIERIAGPQQGNGQGTQTQQTLGASPAAAKPPNISDQPIKSNLLVYH